MLNYDDKVMMKLFAGLNRIFICSCQDVLLLFKQNIKF